VADPENRSGAFSLEPNPFASEAFLQLMPAAGLPEDRRRNLERYPLSAALPNPLLEVPGRTGRVPFDSPTRSRSLELAVLPGEEQRPTFTLPALVAFDARDGAMGDLWSKPLLTVTTFSVSGCTRLTASRKMLIWRALQTLANHLDH
jgi:hypothetical protein